MKKVSTKSKIFLLLGILVIPISIFSIIFTTQVKASKLVLLDQNQTVDKTYFASGDVLDIRGNINGDAFLAGSDITFSGNINGNLFVAANSINLSGKVNGNVFSAGNSLTINSEGIDNLFVAGNLININSKINKNSYVAGNSVVISNNSEIGQDLFIGASAVTLNADVKRDLSVDSTTITLGSNIGRDASIISESAYFSLGSKIGNNLEVSDSIRTASNLNEVAGGKISVKETQSNPGKEYIASFKSKVFGKLTFGLFSVLIVGLLLIKFFGKTITKLNKDIEKNFGKNLGKGFLLLILIPIISVVLLITIIGIKLSFIAIGIYTLLIFFSSIIGSIFIGEMFLRKLIKEKNPSQYLSLLIGSLIYIIFTVIPFVGWIVGLLITVVSLGALINYKVEVYKMLNKKA